MEVRIRVAIHSDVATLTTIAFAAKRTWNYPEEYYQIWNDELTITEQYIDENAVFVALVDEVVVGFVSIVHLPEEKQFGLVKVSAGYWMDHLFVDPGFQYNGIGKRLMDKAINYCKGQGIINLKIFVDPNATGFYEKIGAKFLEDSPSSIKGRFIPIYVLEIK